MEMAADAALEIWGAAMYCGERDVRLLQQGQEAP